MRRREFITGLGSAAAWPVAARAQQADRVRRIGVLMSFDENDPVSKPRLSALTHELVGLQPDIILTNGTAATVAVQQETRTIPIVFNVGEPVASGIVARLDRPGGDITGFATSEASMGGKWL